MSPQGRGERDGPIQRCVRPWLESRWKQTGCRNNWGHLSAGGYLMLRNRQCLKHDTVLHHIEGKSPYLPWVSTEHTEG